MAGLLDFTSIIQNVRQIASKAANYTLVAIDELVQLTGSSAATFTLPGIDSLIGTTQGGHKAFFIANKSTANLTVAPGTRGDTGAAQTIGGRAQVILPPGFAIAVHADQSGTNFAIDDPNPIPVMRTNTVTLVATTNGTTAVNLVDSSGSPVNGEILAVVAVSQDTNAANITVTNGTETVCTIAKSTTAGVPIGDAGLTYANVASGAALTIASSATNGNAKVIVNMAVETLA